MEPQPVEEESILALIFEGCPRHRHNEITNTLFTRHHMYLYFSRRAPLQRCKRTAGTSRSPARWSKARKTTPLFATAVSTAIVSENTMTSQIGIMHFKYIID